MLVLRLPQPRQRAMAVVLVVVVLAHGMLLATLPREKAPGRGLDAGRIVHLRTLASALPAPASRLDPAPAVPARRAIAKAPALRNVSSKPASAPTLKPTPAVATVTPKVIDPGGLELPLYAVRLPTATTWQYTVQRGAAAGAASLRWQPGPEGYTLTLEARLDGRPALAWASQGTIDANGMAPARYVESRRGREQRAANFQRASGRITFSGAPVELPLRPGAQDRLSWLLQLAGVLNADPALGAAGQTITLFVAGARGDGLPWRFNVVGVEDIDLPAGPTRTLRLQREPERPYDTRAEVWLDPARGHLPVQVRWRAPPALETTELRLQTTDAP